MRNQKLSVIRFLPLLGLLLPVSAFAQAGSVTSIISGIGTTANTVIGILFVLATLVFLWGLVKFIANADNPAERAKARGLMIWGIIGLAVMAAAWGITYILVTYFGVGTTAPTFVVPPSYP